MSESIGRSWYQRHIPFARKTLQSSQHKRFTQAQTARRIPASMGPADHLERLSAPAKQELAGDAIVYASQHGLVGLQLFAPCCAL